ncbi:MAG TPA: penicillin-insensitive murein endopeptidase [Polyangiaceae bacterium]|nr:penicillin-insensitive murein endopeptidase [Polyangiaceae bacterium]
MRATASLFAILGLALSGCFSAPTPLAPGLFGSVGMPNSGVQTGAVELPLSGKGFQRYRPQGKNHWGRPRLVQSITRIAAEIDAELPGGTLVIGDLGAKTGGRIPGHASHRSGRDVDLLFYALTPAGAPLESPGFVKFEADGLAVVPDSGDYIRLDVAREWLLVKKLVDDPELGVQFLFISRPLEALLMDYARARGEPLELQYRVQTVMLQPGDSLPHDDHLHLRIACSPEEAQAGCSGGGPYWEWLPPLPESRELDPALLEQIAADEPLEPLDPPGSLPLATTTPDGGGA